MLKVENTRVFNFDGALRGLRNPKNSWNKSDSQYGVADLTWGSDEMNDVAHSYLEKANMPNSTLKQEEAIEEYYESTKDWLDKNGLDRSFLSEGNLFEYNFIGPNDLKLAQMMVGAGTDESKFMRQIFISMDITAPLYWWKEFDTYKVGTVSDSCSTMHKIHAKEFELEDFSYEHLSPVMIGELKHTIKLLNIYRDLFVNWDSIALERKAALLRPNEKGEFSRKDAWWQMIQYLPSSYNQKRTITMNYQVARAIFFARKNHKLDEWHTLCKIFESLPYGRDLICYEKPKRLPAFTIEILESLGVPYKAGNNERDQNSIMNDILRIVDSLKK